jgi:hypothetical protein
MADQHPFNEGTPGSEKDATSLTLAYFSCPPGPDKNFLGGLLITDARSRPLHFGYVAPVRPTPMQRLLYGGTLHEHVRVDVIAKKLFSDGVPVVPDVLFVDDKQLLTARRVVKVPTALLERRPASDTAFNSLSTVQYSVDQHSGDDDAVGRILAALEQAIDLIEPFNRIREALKEALKEHKG